MATRSSVRRTSFICSTAALAVLLVGTGCGRKAARVLAGGGTGMSASHAELQAFGKSGSILLTAATDPKTSFHLSCKGQNQINPRFPMDEKAKPEFGPTSLEADISPDKITAVSVRGGKKSEAVAEKTKELDWAMVKLALLGPISDVTMTMAFASTVAKLAGPDTVGGAAADRYDFDTRTASVAQKLGLDAATKMLGARVRHEAIYGTVSVDKASGMLVKWNMDVELSDTKGNTWKEHYEGEAIAKK